MTSEITDAISSLKVAYELTKALLGLADARALEDTVSELRTQIFAAVECALAAQATQAALAKRVTDLEAEAVKAKDWAADKKRYELQAVGESGAFAYVVKESMRGMEPRHSLCANCFNRNRKSVLQGDPFTYAGKGLKCLACKAAIAL